VTIRTLREDGEAVVRVGDDGVGIPREMLGSIFDLFVQSARTLDRAAGGLGLGLTVVRSLVAMHGGTVVADSDGEGKGSEFVVRLPMCPTPAYTEPPRQRPRPVLTDGAKPKVVIVEDSPDSRELLCDLLKETGFDCHTADNGSSALRLVDEVTPHIAILDIGIPEIDGLEVARRLRASAAHANMFLIALTGYGQSADRIAAREAGFDEHLVKPVDPVDLVALLNSLREGAAHRRAHDGAARHPAVPPGEQDSVP
jgi:two-component system CheB/CheR fusion protein